jgi:diguanylate cyclase
VLLLSTAPVEAECVAARIRGALAEPLDVEGHVLAAHGSVGVAVGRGRDGTALLRVADAAMYEAKQAGKVGFNQVLN